MRGRVTLLAVAAAISLAACGPVQSAGDVVAAAPTTVAQVRDRYEGAKAFAEMLLPFLPAKYQDRATALENKIERLLRIAETAATIAARKGRARQGRCRDRGARFHRTGLTKNPAGETPAGHSSSLAGTAPDHSGAVFVSGVGITTGDPASNPRTRPSPLGTWRTTATGGPKT